MSSSVPERTPQPLSDELPEDRWSTADELERRLEAHLLIARQIRTV